MGQIFQNITAIVGKNAPSQVCASLSYTPALTDIRYFRLSVVPSSTGIADVMSPDIIVNSVPNALVAQTVTPAGANKQIQYNNSGSLAASNGLWWNDSSNMFNVGNVGASGQIIFNNNSSNEIISFGTGEIRVLASGNINLMGTKVGIGTTSPAYQLQLSTDSAAKPGTSTWTIASDERLKDIRKNFNRGLASIDQISPIYFKYKEDNALSLPSDKEYVGVRAQEILKVVPEAVSQDEAGYYHVTNDAVIWTMLNSIKELYHKWTSHSQIVDSEIQKLKDENKKLKEQLNKLEMRLVK